MSVTGMLHRYWDGLRRGRPGHRFQDRYDRAKRSPKRSLVVRVSKIVVAIAAIVVGLAEIVFPGPASVFLLVGGALLAGESRVVARGMDWLEVHIRPILRYLHHRWRAMSRTGRKRAVAVVACASVASAVLVYRVMAQ